MGSKFNRQIQKLDLTPFLLRDVEDLATLAKSSKGTNGEGLFARTTVIVGVIALDHFIDFYFERISPKSKKVELQCEFKRRIKDRKIAYTVVAKWYVISDFYTPNRFLTSAAPFTDLKKLVSLRNRLTHLYQKQVKSRSREGVPNLLREVNWQTAEWARDTTKAMISAFYQMAYKPPPVWLNCESVVSESE